MGVVNHGHRYPDGKLGEHMHVHVHHEGVSRKGSNDVSSLKGHTKNACDHLFNALKKTYRSTNTSTMCDLLQKLNMLNSVTVHPSARDDFFNCTALLGRWYNHLAGQIKTNHIFRFSRTNAQVGDRSEAHICQSDLSEHQAEQQGMIKKNFAKNTGYHNYRDAAQRTQV